MNEFNNLPTSIKIGTGTVGLVTLGGAGYYLRSHIWWFLGILAVLLLLFLGGWLLWRASKRRRNNAQISGGLVDDARATPKGISDPAKRAKLDDLRKKFQQGVQEYRSRGKDLYKLPWYVICGPPGAGKTEAIRRCNVGFPPGMQDGLQGVGGTINMNWWFTNQAVILDTAGKLMFEEVSPGETSEWREFLTLLKKSRANCPINGLFLAISVEDLIKDSSEKILQKAGKIAQQLDVIQRVLDVRFPVYVIVTKCDLLAGFREFFDDITDPQLQHQMVGWSNPEALDTPFRPELIDQHLKSVSQRLRGRRMGLLRDPIPESTEHRRIDEVDAMFALPNSLTLIGPRLRRYLETIFVAGEWSAKPLFLRGIYFTSSMREGSALDEELAQAIGVPVGELPDRRGWERERSFFLRDLFMEKVFKERGLVTSATNTKRLLSRRRAMLYGTGFAFFALFALFVFLGSNSFEKRIGNQAYYWQVAAKPDSWKSDKNGIWTWEPIVGKESDWMAKMVAGLPDKRADVHAQFRRFAEFDIPYGMFSPISRFARINPEQRRKAQRVLFDASVLGPVVNEARSKLGESEWPTNETAAKLQSDALLALINLEKQISAANTKQFTTRNAEEFLKPLLSFLLSGEVAPKTNLTTTMSWTYSQGAGANEWPPARLSETNGQLVIDHAFEQFLGQVIQTATNTQGKVGEFTRLRADFGTLSAAEARLLARVSAAGSASELEGALSECARAFSEWENKLTTAQGSVLKGNDYSSARAYTNVVEKNRDSVIARMGRAREVLLNAPPSLARKMTDMVEEQEGKLKAKLVVSPEEADGLLELDRRCLRTNAAGVPLFRVRKWAYDEAAKLTPSAKDLVGNRFESFFQAQTNVAAVWKALAGSEAGPEAIGAVTNYLHNLARKLTRDTLSRYAADAKSQVEVFLEYPMVSDADAARPLSAVKVSDARNLIERILADLSMNNPGFSSLKAWEPGALNEFEKTLQALRAVSTGLLGSNNVASGCKVTLVKQNDTDGNWRNVFNIYEYNGKKLTTPVPNKEETLADKLTIDQPFELKFYRFAGDATPTEKISHGAWAPLRMLQLYSGEMSEGGVRRATVRLKDLSVINQAPVPLGSVQLEFVFEGALPSFDKWPKRQSILRGLTNQ